MRTIFKYIFILSSVILLNGCVEEYGDPVSKGSVSFKLQAPEAVDLSATDMTVRVKLYREYTGATTDLELKVDSVSATGLITSEESIIEYGRYKLQLANVLDASKKPLYVAVSSDDDRAVGISEDSLLPITENVVRGELSTFSLATVLFDVDKDKVAGISEPYTYAFDGTKNDAVAADGWTNVNVSGTNVWQYKSFNENSYAQMSANKGGGGAYETWMISPALNLDAVANKTISFKSLTGYANGAQLKLFVLDSNDPTTATKTELTYAVAPDTEGGYASEFTESGAVNLSSYSGDVYVGFQYVGEDGQTTTFQVDDFKFAVDEAPSGGDANTIASFLALEDGVVGTIEGEVTKVTVNPSYNTVTSLILKDAENAELMVYGVVKVSDVIYEVGQTLKVTGERDNYNGTDQLSLISADKGHSIEVVGGSTDPSDASLLFTGSDFEDWSGFTGSLNKYGLKDYAVQSTDGGRSGSSALHINGTPTGNDYIFTATAGTVSLPASPSKIVFYIKGTSDTKSLSCNIYDATGAYAKVNLKDCSGTADVNLDLSADANDYVGAINTGGEWLKVSIDVTGYNFATESGSSLFALKVGKTATYDLYIDDITIE
ncbi:MAG: choice-of-anchor J domain-containing protein [Bacteroidales bacterium]